MSRRDLDIPVYTIYNSNKYESYKECFKELDNLYHMVKNYIKRHHYNDVSFIIGMSNIDSKTAKINYINTGNRGRPKKTVIGKEIKWHIHLYVASEKTSISVFSNELRQYLQHKKKIVFMQKKNHLNIALLYVEKQCCNIRKYGNGFKKNNI